MLSLCHLYQVPNDNYLLKGKTKESREVDFFLINNSGEKFHCEVKLMGAGNPESADGTIVARDTHVFIADKLSETNKTQLDNHNIHWIELREGVGYRKFSSILTILDVPFVENSELITEEKLEEIFLTFFTNNSTSPDFQPDLL